MTRSANSCKYLLCVQWFVTVRNSCGKVMFSQASVILFTGGVYPSIHWGRPPDTPFWVDTLLGSHFPPGRHPPWTGTPWADTPQADTPGRHPPRRPLQRTVHILLECNLVHFCVTRHVSIMGQSCIESSKKQTLVLKQHCLRFSCCTS